MIESLSPTIQNSQKIEFQILNRPSLALQFHQIANGINFQPPVTQLFFNLLVQATKTSPMVQDCTQLVPINNNDKCHNSETHQQWTKGGLLALPLQNTLGTYT